MHNIKNATIQNVATLTLAFVATLILFSTSLGIAAAEEDNQPIVGTPTISESQALQTANKAYTGTGAFTDIELEMEDGVLVFAVEYTEKDGNEVDVKINAKTGVVVLVESDKDEAVDDDENDVDDAETERISNMQTLINLLNQLVALLRQRGV
jgi:hypothetical protein